MHNHKEKPSELPQGGPALSAAIAPLKAAYEKNGGIVQKIPRGKSSFDENELDPGGFASTVRRTGEKAKRVEKLLACTDAAAVVKLVNTREVEPRTWWNYANANTHTAAHLASLGVKIITRKAYTAKGRRFDEFCIRHADGREESIGENDGR